MSDSELWVLIHINHGGSFNHNEVLAALGAAMIVDDDLQEMCNTWPPQIKIVNAYRSNGDEWLIPVGESKLGDAATQDFRGRKAVYERMLVAEWRVKELEEAAGEAKAETKGTEQ